MQAIAQFGTDFTMVAHLLPGRTRNQVRNKFNREEKKHPERIKEVLYRKRLPMGKSSQLVLGLRSIWLIFWCDRYGDSQEIHWQRL